MRRKGNKHGKSNRSTALRGANSLESMEPRLLLAGDLVANWVADDLDANLEDGAAIASWVDSISGIQATATGTPILEKGELSGRSTVRFNPADGTDFFKVTQNDSPMSGAADFTVTVAFASDSNALTGGNGDWFSNTALVNANRLGFTKDWGITLNPSGQVSAGMGRGLFQPVDSGYSNLNGLNDGQIHFATITRSGGALSIYVDQDTPVAVAVDTGARDSIDMAFGAMQNDGSNPFTGDIAQIQIYNGQLSPEEVSDLHRDLNSYYNNLAPVAEADSYTFTEDPAFGFNIVVADQGVLQNDVDVEGNALTAVLVTQTQNGTVNLTAEGGFTWDPPNDFFGTDSFTYVAFDGQNSNEVTVSLTVTNVYDKPTATADQYKTTPSGILSVNEVNGLLANDLNPDQANLSVQLVQDNTAGSLTLNPNGSFTYNPNGVSGTQTFTYRIADGTGFSDPTTVTLVVNSAPVATNDAFSVNEDQTLTRLTTNGVLQNDSDAEGNALTVSLISDVTHGSLALQSNGAFTYTPTANYFGTDSFTYQLSDGIDQSTVATVQLTVNSVNDIPVGVNDVYTLVNGTQLNISAANGVLRNDSDVEGSNLTAALVSGTTNGSITLNADGAFVYTANDGFEGTDQFTYRASDGSAQSPVITVQINVGQSPVEISEFMVANVSGLSTRTRDDAGSGFRGETSTPDWIELRNLTSSPLDIGGFHLTDSRNDLTKWNIPAGTTIPADGYLVIFASRLDIQDTNLDEAGHLHTNFKLQPEGEYLAITTASGTPLHEFGPSYPNQRADVSYGLDSSGEAVYFTAPTPGQPNAGATLNGISSDTKFNIDRGFFSEPFTVEITTADPEAQIWYTTDGSEPSPTNGTLYSADSPVQISTTTNLRAVSYKTGMLPSLIDSQTYLFLSDVLQQDGEGLESAQWGDNGPDWAMDPDIVNSTDPEVKATEADLQSIPTVSITTDWDWFFGQQGIYPWDPGRGIGVARDGYEIPVSFEYFDVQGNSTQAYSTIQIVGGSSPDRNVNDWKSDKLSMRVKFTEDVGKSSLDYPIFGPDAATSFSTLTVDARLNNVWTYSGGSEPTGQRGRALYMRDEYAADLQNAAGGLAPHGNHVHVYINGVYWGLHTLHERPDDSFNASYQGGDNDDFDSIKHNTSPSNVLNGTNENYLALLSLVREDMSDQANYQAVADKLDIEQFITYMMVNQYGGNQDWAHQNWYASYNRVDPNGKWQFHSWDAEKVLTGVNDNVVTKNDSGGPTEIFTRLSSNEEFRQQFMDLAHKHFFHGGTFTVERATELFQIRVDEIDSAIRAESARWGDNQQSRPYTRLDWLDNVNSYLNTYFPRRTDIVLAQYQRRNLWVTEDKLPPTFMINGQEQYGGYAAVGSSLTMSAAAGTIYYTTDGSDPRLPGGDVSADALTYSSALQVNGITQVKARLRTADGSWSPLSDATFSDAVPADGSNLRISEINYHPADPTPAEEAAGIGDPDEFEFIELVNISNQTIDLSNVAFRQVAIGDAVEGIQFQFADGDVATLAAGQRLVVVENMDAFRLRYGNDPLVAGEWSGKLGNSSEPILLVAGETEIHNFIYSDDWHASTDGDGKTLQSINESGELAAWGTAAGWRASSVDGGTPGQSDEGRIPGDSNGDGIFNSSDLVIVFTAGEYEDAIVGNSTFEEGDWNGDGDFNTSDLVFAFQAGTYVANAVATPQQAFIAPDLSDRFGATRRKHDVIAKQAYFATVTGNQTLPAEDLGPIRFEQIDQAFAEASSSSSEDTDESNELDRLIQDLLQN